MRKDASNKAIDRAVDEMKLGHMNAFITRAIFKYSLRKRAYSKADFLRMVAATPFRSAEIREETLGFDVWLRK
jgi:hypothetical protein